MAISKITNDGIGDINELTVDTDTLVVDSTNNRVGIGTSSPSYNLEITNGTSPAYVVQTRGDLQTILGPTGNLVTSAGQVGTITSSPFRFTTNNTERMRLLAGGGLTFNGDTATANALDDYEEGTWTATTDQGTLSSSSVCKYVKVGNLVTVTGLVSNFSNRTSTGAVVIRGLPFATGSTDIAIGATLSRYINATGDQTSLYLGGNRSYILFYNMNQGTNYDQVRHADLNNTNANFHFTLSYREA